MAPERRTNRANARAASTLLLPKLAACAADFALVFRLVRARAQSAQIPARSFVQQVRIHLRAKYRVGELHLPDLLAIQIDYIHDRHNLDSFFSQLPVLNQISEKERLPEIFLLRSLGWRSAHLLGVLRAANENVSPAGARHGAAHQ